MLLCIVIDFLLNSQPDALIIQIYSVIKLYMFQASSLPIIRSLLPFSTVPTWLCLEAVIRNLHENYQCQMYSRKLLMMGREDSRNMYSFIREQIWIISASGWLFNNKYFKCISWKLRSTGTYAPASWTLLISQLITLATQYKVHTTRSMQQLASPILHNT